MSKPFDTTSPMFRIIEKQLVDALQDDHADISFGHLGPKGRLTLAEIMGAVDQPATVEDADARIIALLEYKKLRWPERAKSLLEGMHAENLQLHAEIDRLTAVIHKPENDDFLRGVSIESEFQRQKHGVDESLARRDWPQWLWVGGYLLNKALSACLRGDWMKARHHLVTTAALLHNWHNVLSDKPAASVHQNDSAPIAEELARD